MTPPDARAGSFPPSNESGDQAPRSHHSPIESWLPIATAPRSGRNIWLGDPGNTRIGFWFERDQRWVDLSRAEARGPSDLLFDPTHWQPLPAPPEVTP